MDDGPSFIGWSLFGLLLVLVFALIWIVNSTAADETRDKEQFAGACKVLNGEVRADLCIKDDRVVLDRNEFDKES